MKLEQKLSKTCNYEASSVENQGLSSELCSKHRTALDIDLNEMI